MVLEKSVLLNEKYHILVSYCIAILIDNNTCGAMLRIALAVVFGN